MHRFSILFACLLLSPTLASAQSIGVDAIIGFSGEASIDEPGSGGKDEWDVEDNFGLALTLLLPLSDQLSVGPRAAFIESSNDFVDSFSSTDLGLWVRYDLSVGELRPFIGVGGGASYFLVEIDDGDDGIEIDGWGYHALGGLGVRRIFKGGAAASLGAFFSYQRVGKVESEEIDTRADVAVRRVLVMAGLSF